MGWDICPCPSRLPRTVALVSRNTSVSMNTSGHRPQHRPQFSGARWRQMRSILPQARFQRFQCLHRPSPSSEALQASALVQAVMAQEALPQTASEMAAVVQADAEQTGQDSGPKFPSAVPTR